jgi:hypothetical protein
MGDVTGVRARPGGRVTLRFTDSGFRAVARPQGPVGKVVDRLLGDLGCGLCLLVVVLAGGVAAHLWETGDTGVALVLATVAAPCAVVVLTRVVVEIVGHAVFVVGLVGAVLLAPLLLFPGVRAWARAWWKKEPSRLDRLIPVSAVEPVKVTRDGRTVTVTVLVDGRPVAYSARDGAGDSLDREFRAMLSARGTATGIGT